MIWEDVESHRHDTLRFLAIDGQRSKQPAEVSFSTTKPIDLDADFHTPNEKKQIEILDQIEDAKKQAERDKLARRMKGKQ